MEYAYYQLSATLKLAWPRRHGSGGLQKEEPPGFLPTSRNASCRILHKQQGMAEAAVCAASVTVVHQALDAAGLPPLSWTPLVYLHIVTVVL